jgi:tRNA-Thr(GGU) m(6)t(6)A37 methyltransferase TsaA
MSEVPPDRFAAREGEVLLPFDPATQGDATVTFIGRMRTPWAPEDCPKNLRQARERGMASARVELDAPYRAGLEGIEQGAPLVLLYWMAGAPRDLIRQAPKHRDRPAGVFALRSPARPNPVAMAVVRCLTVDPESGVLTVDAADCWDGTPLIDIKPWLDTVDLPPN